MRKGHGERWLWVVVAAFALFAPLFFLAAQELVAGGDLYETHTNDAASFFVANVASYLKLPDDAKIVNVEYCNGGYDDIRYTVKFRHPGQSPEKELDRIWESNGFAPDSHSDPLSLSAYHSSEVPKNTTWKFSKTVHGQRDLRYDPAEGVYIAVLGMD